MEQLDKEDLHRVVRRIPKDVRDLLVTHGNVLFLGGGFIRAIVAGEVPSDIDMFGPAKQSLQIVAGNLEAVRGGKDKCRVHRTKNAISVISVGRLTVQFITRWSYSKAEDLINDFDFTVCQAAVYYDKETGHWMSVVGAQFYHDLAVRRLRYTAPQRDEEAGGSLLRALKYQRRGYVLPVETLAAVITRLVGAVDQSKMSLSDPGSAKQILTALLREVDPLLVVDGLEVTDDHETPIEGIPEDV